uniref:AAA family ATPase n=1 Tax=Agathobacter sp. TaxID=2021311 RepID=UPI00405611CA
MATMSVKQAAKIWNISERRVAALCRDGKIDGAKKQGHIWHIPSDAQNPTGNRIRTDTYIKADEPKLPLPVGISDYRLASSSYYYVDKTMMIKEFLDERPMVSLFLRPRRFGKTLNMDMLRVFFEKTDEDTSCYFNDKKIWACGERYRAYQGKYPVIFVSFKDVKFKTWKETLDNIADILRKEFGRHKVLLDSSCCSMYEKDYFNKVLNKCTTEVELTGAFRELTQMLHEHYGVAPVIIIDEYDTPIQQGHVYGFYEDVVLFMRNLFSGGLKDNHHLSYGFMTGILRVAKESIFSGLNNLKINSVLEKKYSEYFGFTPQEIKEMCAYYGVSEKYEEICIWYDGYRFGKSDIFNPWSVINYFSNDCEPAAFWQSTGSNEIIEEILENATEEIYERLQLLLQGKSFLTYVDTSVIYPQIRKNPSSVYSFLLVAGYLKLVKAEVSTAGGYMCEVALPNKEIAFVYNKEILAKLEGVIPQATAVSLQEAVYLQDVSMLQKYLNKLLAQSVSYFDTMGENFYHGLMLGLCAMFDNHYFVSSNREAGEGRYDIALFPKDEKLPGIMIEIKAQKNCSIDELKKLAEKAFEQIGNKKYDAIMKEYGIRKILRYGVAFSGKRVEIFEG